MEQRRLRLGDIVDDYCPRERRLTDHAIVAMIEEDIKQTRCTACDAEHAYKGARVPKRRKKDDPVVAGALALAAEGVVSIEGVVVEGAETAVATLPDNDPIAPAAEVETAPASSEATNLESQPPEQAPPMEDEAPAVDGPVHRPLIRATLPRPEGQKDVRQVPEFTVRHSAARGFGRGNPNSPRGERGRPRGAADGNGHGAHQGNRPPNSGARFHAGSGNRPFGPGRQPGGRGGSPSGFRSGNAGPSGKRGRGSRG